MPVAVITDSTAYLPSGWAVRYGIRVVPVQVIVGGRPLDETDADQAQQVVDALTRLEVVTTSRPSPERFAHSYRDAQAAGATHIVVATLSASMSSTYESATIAAREVDIPVTVVDSRTIAMGLGFAVRAGAEVAATGASDVDVAGVIARRAQAAQVLFYVDTLEYLKRGGRITGAKAAVGQVLQVKPLLHVADGEVRKLEQVRTTGKAMARLLELTRLAADAHPCDIAVQSIGAQVAAHDLADTLRSLLPACEVVEAPVGGVIGAHVGPGMVAVVISPRG